MVAEERTENVRPPAVVIQEGCFRIVSVIIPDNLATVVDGSWLGIVTRRAEVTHRAALIQEEMGVSGSNVSSVWRPNHDLAAIVQGHSNARVGEERADVSNDSVAIKECMAAVAANDLAKIVEATGVGHA
jgi:predicted nucleotidyltransferase